MSETAIIERLGAQGDGATACGAHLPFTLPGEEVRLADGAVLTPSPDRVEPVCRHFGTCGGCALQHASDTFLAGWKREQVIRALASRGIEGVEVAETLTSPPGSRRRATFSGKRTKSGTLVGFHARGSEEVIALEECPLVTPALTGLLPLLADLTALGASRKGVARFTVTDYPQGPEVVAEQVKPADGPLLPRLAALGAAAGLSRLVWAGEPVAAWRAPVERLGPAEVAPPPGAFLQATREGAAALTEAVLAHLAPCGPVADLFCGIGTFTLPLAAAHPVAAFEGDEAAVAALDAGWRRAQGLQRVRAVARDLFRRPLRPEELKGIEGAVIDPPRQGARAQAEALAASGVERIAMVSCNPATFARDARTLIDGGYRLGRVIPVDQFRWSPHVELMAAFSR